MTREARLLAVAASLGMLSAGPAFAIEPGAAPGAYCPFPEPGQKPACLAPVQERYPAFLEDADRGRIDEAVTAGVEADLTAASDTSDAYLALSSLAYAYYRLAQREAANPGADPALVRRLEHWNGLLSGLYHDADADPGLRGAVFQAASDLSVRAPAVGSNCTPGTTACGTTSGLMLALRSADHLAETQGVRGALARLLGRIFGRGEPRTP